MYKIVMSSWGGTKKNFADGLIEKEAVELCDSYGWEYSEDGGYVWDLEIEEDD